MEDEPSGEFANDQSPPVNIDDFSTTSETTPARGSEPQRVLWVEAFGRAVSVPQVGSAAARSKSVADGDGRRKRIPAVVDGQIDPEPAPGKPPFPYGLGRFPFFGNLRRSLQLVFVAGLCRCAAGLRESQGADKKGIDKDGSTKKETAFCTLNPALGRAAGRGVALSAASPKRPLTLHASRFTVFAAESAQNNTRRLAALP